MMSQQTLDDVVLTLDTKKYRIRIHKQVYHNLGNPKLLQFLVNPEDGIIAVRGTDHRTPGDYSVRVNLDKPEGEASCDVYCKYFIERLLYTWQEINRGSCYILTGTLNARQRAAFFPVATLELISEK